MAEKTKEQLLEELRYRIENERDFHSTTEGCDFDNEDCSVMDGYNDMLRLLYELEQLNLCEGATSQGEKR